jgi:hypothetical protein
MSLWFGYEWEIAVSGTHKDGSVVAMPRLLDSFDAALVKHMRHVDAESIGWWLESGGKFYRDASESGASHNEYASPECSHPDELLCHSIAADRMLLGLADLVKNDGKLGEVRVSKANVSHAAVESWGSHENYEANKPVPNTPMLAWLASRILITGSGGLDVTYPGIRFTLSPRAHFIQEAVSNSTQWGRSLHNVGKATPYGTKHRVHVIAGDGSRSPLSTWLRFATTALVVRMIDMGRMPTVALMDPVSAIHEFAMDPRLAVSVLAENGSPSGIMNIQRSFLDCALTSVDVFPDWAPRVLAEWQRVIDILSLEDGWKKLVGQLDWPTKLAWFEKILDRKGWTWERIGEVNRLIDQTSNGINAMSPETVMLSVRNQSPIQHEVLRLAAKEHDPELIREFVGLKQQLATVDARYMELGKESLFETFAVPVTVLPNSSSELPENPLELPMPATGRAKVRAELIREHGWVSTKQNSNRPPVHASWTHFIANEKRLVMPDVAGVDNPIWQDLEKPVVSHRPRSVDSGQAGIVLSAIARAGVTIDSGDYHDGYSALTAVSGALESDGISRGTRASYWTNMVRLCCRQQMEPELSGALRHLGDVVDRLEYLWDSCNSRTWLGLAGHHSVPALADVVKREMETCGSVRKSGSACWKSHMAIWLNRHGRPTEAMKLLQTAMSSGEYGYTSHSVKARIQSQFSEALRMLGDFKNSRKHLKEAEELCRRGGLEANLLDCVLTGWVRFHAEKGKRDLALRILNRSLMPGQHRLGTPNRMRSILLSYRILSKYTKDSDTLHVRDSIADQISRISGFASCPLFEKILHDWSAWCDGSPDPIPPENAEVTDTFWGV